MSQIKAMLGSGETAWGAGEAQAADRDRVTVLFEGRRAHRATAAGVAATALTGTLAFAVIAPQVAVAGPALSSQVRLLSGANPLQPVIDQLLQAQQQIQGDVSQYSFITPADLPMAHEYVQNAMSTMLAAQLVAFNYLDLKNVAIPFVPYAWSNPLTNMQQLLTYANPDNQYSALPLLPGNTYTITITPPTGPNGTGSVTFVFASGDGVSQPYESISSYNLNQATPNADGSYTLTFSSSQPTDDVANWVQIPEDAARTVVRNSVGDWGLPHDSFTISQEGVAAPNPLQPPLLSYDQIASLLGPIAANARGEVASPDYLGQLEVTNSTAPNTVSDFQPTHGFMPGPLLTGNNQWLSAGNYSLQPDQALIMKVPEVNGAYSAAMVTNMYGQTAPMATASGSLNASNTFHDSDGYTYYVISSKDPGVANWLNNNAAENGGIWMRLQGLQSVPDQHVPVETQVVNIADVKDYLPADTPTVTAAERAAELQERLFDWAYTHHQNENIAWLGANLEYDQIKAAVGPDVFNEIFGGQSTYYGAPQELPTVLDRMTDPALIPNMNLFFQEFSANPTGALVAIKDNLSLMTNDILMPTALAAGRMLVLFEQTVQALSGDVSSGQWSNVLTDLIAGIEGVGTVFNQTLSDPATSIVAGLLNARDDLWVSVIHADSYAAPSSGSAAFFDAMSQLPQALSQALNPSTALDAFGTLSAAITSQIAAQGDDLAPIVSGLSDLLP